MSRRLQHGWDRRAAGTGRSELFWPFTPLPGQCPPPPALPPQRPWDHRRCRDQAWTPAAVLRSSCWLVVGWVTRKRAGSALGARAGSGTFLCKARQDRQWWLSRTSGCEHPGCCQHPRPRAPGAAGGEQPPLLAHSVYSPSHWVLVVIFVASISTHEVQSMIKLQVHKQGRSLPVEAE